ncbi:MAG: type VI secretion system protein ImpC [Candidatus Azotimanducaceae bacterium]|jgi:type VI secretion system protein ImpC
MAEAPKQASDRVNLTYESKVGDRVEVVELPFRVLVLVDLTLDERSEFFDQQQPIRIDSNKIDTLFQQLKPTLNLKVDDKLSDDDGDLLLQMSFDSIDSFLPAQVMDAVPAIAALIRFNDALSRIADGENLNSFGDDMTLIQSVLDTEAVSLEEIQQNTESFGWLISSIEERISKQLDAIIHHPDFRRMESAWRSSQFLLERTDFKENTELAFINLSKQALIDDFDDVPEVFQSQLYQHVYSNEFGQFGGRPYGTMIGDYEIGPGAEDIKLLQRLASVAAVSHAPFIAAASAEFFDIDSYSKFSKLRDLGSIFSQPKYAKWNSFRASADAKYIGLTMPGFLLRKTHDVSIGSLQYRESVKNAEQDLLWGNTSFAFVTRLLDSFAQYRWCLNSTGKTAGLVEGLNVEKTDSNSLSQRIPTRFLITDKRETEVVEAGFIPLSVHKGDDTAAFYSAYSTQAVRELMTGENDLSLRLAAQIPYLLIVGRISQYLKIMQRENIGAWTNRSEIDRELNNWLRQYVSDMDNPAPGVRSRRPLRKAEIKVREVEGKNDWYLTRIEITPHLKFMGNTFSLSDTSKLDKN